MNTKFNIYINDNCCVTSPLYVISALIMYLCNSFPFFVPSSQVMKRVSRRVSKGHLPWTLATLMWMAQCVSPGTGRTPPTLTVIQTVSRKAATTPQDWMVASWSWTIELGPGHPCQATPRLSDVNLDNDCDSVDTCMSSIIGLGLPSWYKRHRRRHRHKLLYGHSTLILSHSVWPCVACMVTWQTATHHFRNGLICAWYSWTKVLCYLPCYTHLISAQGCFLSTHSCPVLQLNDQQVCQQSTGMFIWRRGEVTFPTRVCTYAFGQLPNLHWILSLVEYIY